MTRVTWSVPRGTFVGDRLDVSSLVGDDVRTTRATADEVTRRFHRQATATIERLRRAFESSNHRLAFASIRFRFAPSPTERMTDRPFAAKTRCPLSRLDPRSSASSASSRRRRRRRCRLAPSPAPHRTRRVDALPLESSIRIVPIPPFDRRSHAAWFFFSRARTRRVCDAHAHAESSAKVDECEGEREGARAKARARARWTYFRVAPSLFLTRTRRRTVASVRRRVLGDRAATRQWFTIVRRGAFGRDDARFVRGSIGGVERWEEFSFVRLPQRRVGVERCPKTRRRFRASSHRDRVACVNDSMAISSFHCLSARSRATRGRSRRWGRETTPHRRRENDPLARGNRESSGNRARHGRRAANARTAPTALRRPRAFADQHPFVVTRQSIRIIPSRSRGRVDQLAARSFEFLLIAIAARRARARRLSPLFAGFPFVPFVRSVRIAVGGLPRSSCRPPPASSSSFSSPTRFRVPGALVVATSRFSFVRLDGRGARFYEL